MPADRGAGQELPPTQTSAEDQAIGLAQQVPGFAVLGVDVAAVVSLGTEQKGYAIRHLAHGQDVPGIFRDNVDGHEINVAPAVSLPSSAHVAINAHGVQAVAHVDGGFYLQTPESLPSLHDEVKGIARAIRLGHHETELRRFVQEGHFAKIAALTALVPAFPVHFQDRDVLGRWNASAWNAPVFAHGC